MDAVDVNGMHENSTKEYRDTTTSCLSIALRNIRQHRPSVSLYGGNSHMLSSALDRLLLNQRQHPLKHSSCFLHAPVPSTFKTISATGSQHARHHSNSVVARDRISWPSGGSVIHQEE